MKLWSQESNLAYVSYLSSTIKIYGGIHVAEKKQACHHRFHGYIHFGWATTFVMVTTLGWATIFGWATEMVIVGCLTFDSWVTTFGWVTEIVIVG